MLKLKLSQVVETLECMFDALNQHYFERALPTPIITVQSTPIAYGHCTVTEVWQENESAYEINIGAEYLNRPIDQVGATLVHEMVHLYHLVNGVKGTSNGFRYHNSTFKLDAEARGLTIEQIPGIGWSKTTPKEELSEFIAASGFETFEIARTGGIIDPDTGKRAKPENKAASKGKYYKYKCPCCECKIYSAKPVSMRCMDCDEEMELY